MFATSAYERNQNLDFVTFCDRFWRRIERACHIATRTSLCTSDFGASIVARILKHSDDERTMHICVDLDHSLLVLGFGRYCGRVLQ